MSSYGFVPDFNDPIFWRSSSLPSKHTVQREAGGRWIACGKSDFFAAVATSWSWWLRQTGHCDCRWRNRNWRCLLMSSSRVLVHLVMIQSSKGFVRWQNDLSATLLFKFSKYFNMTHSSQYFRPNFFWLMITILPSSNGSVFVLSDKDNWTDKDWVARSLQRWCNNCQWFAPVVRDFASVPLQLRLTYVIDCKEFNKNLIVKERAKRIYLKERAHPSDRQW